MATKAKTLQAKDKEKDDKAADAPEKDSQDAPSPLLDLSDAAVKKMIKQAKKRGFVTFDQLNEVLPSDQTSPEQIEDIMSMLSDMGINVTEADDSDDEEEKDEGGEDETDNELVEVTQKAVTEVKKSEPGERTDDPVRMYLREMGTVELLSREGEIAIAKRIEAGREAMIAGLCESPLTFQAIIIWRDELNEGKIFLRDIIDLEATYAGPDAKAGMNTAMIAGPNGENGEAPAEGGQAAAVGARPRMSRRPPLRRRRPRSAPRPPAAMPARPRRILRSPPPKPTWTRTTSSRTRCRLRPSRPSSSRRSSRSSTRSPTATRSCASFKSRTSRTSSRAPRMVLALAAPGAQVQQAEGRDHRRGEVAAPEPGAYRFTRRAALRHQQAPRLA